MTADPQLFSQRELAVRWHISPRTLERWRWLGCGPRFFKFGGAVRYRLEDIQTYEQSAGRQSTSEREIA